MNILSPSRLSQGLRRVEAARRMQFEPEAPAPAQELPKPTQAKPAISFADTLASVMKGEPCN